MSKTVAFSVRLKVQLKAGSLLLIAGFKIRLSYKIRFIMTLYLLQESRIISGSNLGKSRAVLDLSANYPVTTGAVALEYPISKKTLPV